MFENEKGTYIKHIPEQLREFVEIQALNGSFNIELDKVYAYINQIINNAITDTMSLEIVERWEAIFGIATPAEATIEARRNNILSKFKTQPPINLQALKDIVEAYLGVPVDVYTEGYIVNVRYRGVKKLPDMTPLYQTIYNILPANILMALSYAYYTWEETMNSTWNDLSSESWDSVLG